MPFNGSGTYAAPGSTFNPAVATTTISATDWNALLADLTTALSTCMLKDGQQTPTANIAMGGFKLTGLAAGTGAGNSVRYEQLFNAAGITLLGGLTVAGNIAMGGFKATGLAAGSTNGDSVRYEQVPGVVTTAGDLIYASGAGAFSRLAIGTTGLPLVVNSGATAPQWGFANQTANTVYAGPSSGAAAAPAFRALTGADGAGLVYLATKTASASTSLDFTTSDFSWTAYDVYVFEIVRLLPATNNVSLYIRLSTDGGSTFEAGATSYAYANKVLGANGTIYDLGSGAGDTGAAIGATTNGTSNTTANGGLSATVKLFGPNNTANQKLISWIGSYGGNTSSATISGSGFGATNLTASAVNGIRFIQTSGNITSGTIRAYGIRNS